jgi:hypothetical protein
LREVSGTAVCSKVLTARGGVNGAVEQYMLYSLDGLATWAGHLFRRVLGKEPLSV